jgi:Hsp70 protein
MVEFSGMALAIDFGSSNTAAAFRDRHGHVQEVRLSATGTLMPSGVFFDGSRFLVGRTALQAAFTSPEAFEPSPKRRLADREIFLAGSMVPVTKMVAAVFAEVLAKASGVMGGVPDVIVVTHPDQWSGPLQQLLAEGAVAGGVEPNRMCMVSEAQAAAWFYAKSAPAEVAVGSRLVVFDFGAGTCDVAVLDKQPDQTFAVIASDGLDGLGGQDLDARIQAWVRRQLAVSDPVLLAEVNEPASIATRLTLNDRIRDAKEALSEASSAAIVVAAGANTQVLQLTRDEFDEIIGSDIGRAVELTKRVMAEANERVPSNQTPTIYLTGGSSHIPLVHSRLAELAPLGVLGDPKTVVVQGALYTPQASPAPPPPGPPPPAATAAVPGSPLQPAAPAMTSQNAPAMADLTSGPIPTPAAPMASGPMPTEQPPAGRPTNPMKRWIIVGAGAIAVILVAVIVIFATGVFNKGAKPSPSSVASASSTTSAASSTTSAIASASASPTSTGQLAGNDLQLFGLLPRGYRSSSCTAVSPPLTGALSTLDCNQNSFPGGPANARYSLFADANALATNFQKSMGEDTLMPCPGGTDSPGTWHYDATPNQTAGSIACGTYKGTPDVMWTKDSQLILGAAEGPNLNDLHQWWLKYA